MFAAIREEPGNVSVKTMEREVFKLGAIKAVGLREGVFGDVFCVAVHAAMLSVVLGLFSQVRAVPRGCVGDRGARRGRR